jgi:2-polyprenyl-3-methyl-5-hydroxy-6-metoxy-1,4-benzoquinol methylase
MASNTAAVDAEKVEAFGERLIGVLNGGALTLMLSVGHRTGLFDAMADMPPATSAEIAERAGLKERYVREWLGAMVTGGIVAFDAGTGTYQLPAEHAALLTRAAAPNNFAVTTQWIPVLANVENEIVECFREGGGVPYSSFGRFHEVMAEESGQTVVAALLDQVLPLAEGLTERLREGIDVLDVGCGSGRALNLMAAAFPKGRFRGYDASEEAIAAAQSGADERGMTNVHFAVKDVAALGEREAYDLITAFDVIHDQAKPAKVLGEIAAALRTGGTFLMQDIAASSHVHKNLDHPIGSFLYTISCMHCMTVSLAQGGDGLGTVWGEEKALDMLADAGFANVKLSRLPHDIINSYYVARKK